MPTSNDQDACHLLAECVYKHNGRLDNASIVLYEHDFIKTFIYCIPDIIFVSQIDIDEFCKSCEHAGLTIVKNNRYPKKFRFNFSITRVYNDFEHLKKEYKGDFSLVKMVNGQFHVTVPTTITADLVLERSVFRVPFNEFNKNLSMTNPEYVNNLKSKRLTINWACLFENYEKFDSIDSAVKEFIRVMEDNRLQGYSVYNNGTVYDWCILTVMLPIVTAELNAHIASKKAAAESEYTIDQAKKDLESGQQMIDQGQALVRKAAGFLAK